MIEWQMILDEHRWRAEVGNCLRLHISPALKGEPTTYSAIVFNMNLVELRRRDNCASVEEAKFFATVEARNVAFAIDRECRGESL